MPFFSRPDKIVEPSLDIREEKEDGTHKRCVFHPGLPFIIEPHNWVVALMRKPTTTENKSVNREHAFIVAQGMTNYYHSLLRRYDLFIEHGEGCPGTVKITRDLELDATQHGLQSTFERSVLGNNKDLFVPRTSNYIKPHEGQTPESGCTIL